MGKRAPGRRRLAHGGPGPGLRDEWAPEADRSHHDSIFPGGEVKVSKIHKLRCVRALVRPDRRQEYLELWRNYAETAAAVGAKASLYEDQVLPGRFLELTEHVAARGMESRLEGAYGESGLRRACVRREGDEILYRKLVD